MHHADKVLGSGTFGTVFEGEVTKGPLTGTPVAVKRLVIQAGMKNVSLTSFSHSVHLSKFFVCVWCQLDARNSQRNLSFAFSQPPEHYQSPRCQSHPVEC